MKGGTKMTKCDVCGVAIELTPSPYLTYCVDCFKDLPDD
ncbi:hypothetical protein SEA_GUUELAD_125 [Mycobacterium phage GuuelaD]|uniref:Uncharacterized protein n=2 Tax=Faithunavirus TaxID=2948705 RepID=A0A286MQM3_9CAUD|nr:hypothetical protein J4T97_gp116 [Mycobacterium phage GuuelaD]ASW31548.1 hypothetical protein SEA_GUUELAD_125 [Mycobacterium phage GuuelaD]QDH92620.1 hypothetical protein SEA_WIGGLEWIGGLE_128 [Mycobacterium phage Wigglewiggle]